MAIDVKAHDIIVDDNGEVQYLNGDFIVSVSNDEHAKAIMYSFTGDWKQYPKMGCNLQDYLNGDVPVNTLSSIINNQLTIDGFIVDNLDFSKNIKKVEIYLKARRRI
jgi:hypothetical protein